MCNVFERRSFVCICTVVNALDAFVFLYTVHFFNHTDIFVSLITFWPVLCETVLLTLCYSPNIWLFQLYFDYFLFFWLKRWIAKKRKLRNLKQWQLLFLFCWCPSLHVTSCHISGLSVTLKSPEKLYFQLLKGRIFHEAGTLFFKDIWCVVSL